MNYSLGTHLLTNGLIDENMKYFVDEQLKGIRVNNSEIVGAQLMLNDEAEVKSISLQTTKDADLRIRSSENSCEIFYDDPNVKTEYTFDQSNGLPEVTGYICLVTEDDGRLLINKGENEETTVKYYDGDSVEHIKRSYQAKFFSTGKYDEGIFAEFGLIPDKETVISCDNEEFLKICGEAVQNPQSLETKMKENLENTKTK